MSESFKDDIKRHEGFRSKVYDDSLGKPTIGYGFLIDALVLDEDIAEMILDRKLEKLKLVVHKTFPWLADQPKEVIHAIYNMSYQMGPNTVAKFKKTLTYLKNKDYSKAAIEMLDSKWARQTPGRAKELSDTIKTLA